MKIDRLIIMDDLEEIQEKVENMGFTESNEFELHYREEIADYIMREFSEPTEIQKQEKANLNIGCISKCSDAELELYANNKAAKSIKDFCEYVMHPQSDLHKDADEWIKNNLK